MKRISYSPPAFQASKASDAKGTLWIHQQGDTKGCFGSLDRPHPMSGKQKEIDSSNQKVSLKGFIKRSPFNYLTIVKFITTHSCKQKLREEGHSWKFKSLHVISLHYQHFSQTLSSTQRQSGLSDRTEWHCLDSCWLGSICNYLRERAII